MKLDIYMKSGNVIRVDDVEEWWIKADLEVTSIFIDRPTKTKPQGLILTSLCLSQIEAIVEL